MRTLLIIIVPPLLIFVCALLIVWLPLPQPFPPALSGGRNQVAAVVAGLLGLAYLVGLALYLIASFRQAGQALDSPFLARGLTAENYLGVGRSYRGSVEGRAVEANYLPAQGLRPALLNVYVAAELGTRAAAGEKRPLLDCRDCAPVDLDEFDLGSLQIWAEDGERLRNLLADKGSRAALNRLVSEQKSLGIRELYWQPERIWLRAHPSYRVAGEQVEGWLDALLLLAKAAE